MKKIAALCAAFLLLCGCAKTPDAGQPSQPTAPISTEFTQKDLGGNVRYSGGGISLEMEGGFALKTSSEGYICYGSDVMDVVIAATDDYDAQMAETYGQTLAQLSPEDYGSLLIDANQLPQDCMYYDRLDNLCMRYTAGDTAAREYAVCAVIKKDESRGVFWLIQFIAAPAVLDAYDTFLPQWAASVEFT